MFNKLAKKYEPEMNRKERRGRAKALLKMGRSELIRLLTTSYQDGVNNYGILSLSANNDNILMWSHYAAAHKGLCLRFEFTPQIRSELFYKWPLPVEYEDSYPKIKITSSNKEISDLFIFTKAIDWCYEEEYRTMDFDNGPGEKHFPPELLTGVILGARMTPENKREVVGWVRARKTPTELLEAHIKEGSFSLEIKPYNGD
ncbi:MAG: DUF2971 domain-containing protein [Nitrospirae bacterium]|nr:DUF2971 domain-containing protein [Nitrospirota bacterium]